jgi:bla regulator protein blaR1
MQGLPNDEQIKTMLQKLLAERFKLTFHHDKRELSVYVISVAGGGPKMTKSTSDPNALPGIWKSVCIHSQRRKMP